jgi:hypothetical protein
MDVGYMNLALAKTFSIVRQELAEKDIVYIP